MSVASQPVLSVIVRRFHKDFWSDVDSMTERLKRAASEQPGYLGSQSCLSSGEDGCEVVTVVSFDSRENFEGWKNSPLRNDFVKELDVYTLADTNYANFEGLSLLASPKDGAAKIAIVAIIIFWILVLGGLLGFLANEFLPVTISAAWMNVFVVTINVTLISYFLLPWSLAFLENIKRGFLKK